MFTLASDLLHDVRVDVQGPHLVIPDRCVQSRSARCGWVAVAREQRGRPFMADRTRPARLPQRPRLTSRSATCQLGLRRSGRLHPDDIGVPRVGGKNLSPGALAPEPSATGSGCASLLSSPRPVVAGPSRREPARLWDRLFGTVRARARDRRHPKVPTWVEIFRGRRRYPKAPPWLTGLPCGPSPGRRGEDCCDPLQDLDIFAEPAVLLAHLRQHPPGLRASPHRVVVVCRGAAG
jgi:hypothetical protein